MCRFKDTGVGLCVVVGTGCHVGLPHSSPCLGFSEELAQRGDVMLG